MRTGRAEGVRNFVCGPGGRLGVTDESIAVGFGIQNAVAFQIPNSPF